MKVTLISFTRLTFYGGIERWIIDLGNELVKRGYKVKVITPGNISQRDNISLKDLMTIINFEYLPINKFNFSYKTLTEFFTFKKIEGVVYLSDFHPMILQFLLSLYSKEVERIIIGTHVTYLHPRARAWRYKSYIVRLLSRKYRKYQKKIYIQAINSAQKKFYEKLGFKNIYLVPNFVDSKEYFYPKDIDEFIVTFMGRFVVQKGIDLLPQIIEKVLGKNKEIKFYIAGSGDKKYEEMLKSLESKYPENVKYFGFIDENTKKEILSKSSLFFISSRFEGFPIAAVEALVSGSPFLGSNIVAFRDLLNIYDKNFGWIEKNYNPEAFANKILEIYNLWKEDPKGYFEKRKYIAKRARELFDIKKVVDEFERVFLK